MSSLILCKVAFIPSLLRKIVIILWNIKGQVLKNVHTAFLTYNEIGCRPRVGILKFLKGLALCELIQEENTIFIWNKFSLKPGTSVMLQLQAFFLLMLNVQAAVYL